MKVNKKSFVQYGILFIFVILMIVIINVAIRSERTNIDLLGKVFILDNKTLLKENNEYYLSYSFIKNNIDKEIYFDNISRKIVISTDTSFIKAKVDDKNITVGFSEEELVNKALIERDDKYISMELLSKAYGFETAVLKNTIYIYEKSSFKCSLKTNRVGVKKYKKRKSRIIEYVNRNDKIVGIREDDEYILVKINNKHIGYIEKNMLDYEKVNINEKNQNDKKATYIFAGDKEVTVSKNLNIDGVFVNAFDINKISGDVKINDIDIDFVSSLKNNGYKVYGIVTNGYNLSGFNRNTTTQILSDETKRIKILKDLIGKMNKYNLDGLVIDFRMLKETDKDNYTQFIKEFNSLNDKESIVNIHANEYKNYIQAINYTDFSIINMYGLRDQNSNVAGSVSEISWMENIIKETIKISDKEKIIACIPAYSILWTEKNSNIVNSEIYNLDAIEDYISKNNLEKKYNENLLQNYVELKKGSLIYKMWVEDEKSIRTRVDIIKKYDLRGVAIYKVGYANKKMLDIVNTIK